METKELLKFIEDNRDELKKITILINKLFDQIAAIEIPKFIESDFD